VKVLSYPALFILIYSACFSSYSLAIDEALQPSNDHVNYIPASTGAIFTAEMRSTIKREVMSKPGVLLDMANMTDNGYLWTNDVVWVGSSAVGAAQDAAQDAAQGVAPGNVQWYIAGFMFQRPRYKGVWLQYAFTLSQSTGEIANFRRWYGNATFR